MNDLLMHRTAVMMASNVHGEPRLPEEYQEVRYLQSDGNQYIKNIPLILNHGALDVYCKFRLQARKTYGPHIFSTSGTNLWLVTRNNSTLKTLFRLGGTDYGYSTVTPLNEDIVASISDGYMTIGNLGDPIAIPRVSSDWNITCAVFIFQAGDPNTYCVPMRIYSLRCMVGQSGIDLVPCYRKSDNKPGMYDLVHDSFYTNTGTGEFTVGSKVN